MDLRTVYGEQKRLKRKKTVTVCLVIFCLAVLSVCFAVGGAPLRQSFSRAFGLANSKDGAAAVIDFLDVGQGSCTLVSSGGEYALVDTGLESGGGIEAYNKLKNKGAGSVKYVFITHCHSDHVGGLLGLFGKIPIENVVLSDRVYGQEAEEYFDSVKDAAARYNVNLVVPKSLDGFALGSGKITVFVPEKAYGQDENCSLAFLAEFCGVRTLFMGDNGFTEENMLLNEGFDLDTDILAVGHHGSKYGTGERFLDETTPSAAVLSFGYNSYGHPTDQVLSRLEKHGCKYYYTFDDSSLSAAIYGGGKYEIYTYKNE